MRLWQANSLGEVRLLRCAVWLGGHCGALSDYVLQWGVCTVRIVLKAARKCSTGELAGDVWRVMGMMSGVQAGVVV